MLQLRNYTSIQNAVGSSLVDTHLKAATTPGNLHTSPVRLSEAVVGSFCLLFSATMTCKYLKARRWRAAAVGVVATTVFTAFVACVVTTGVSKSE